MKKLISLLAVVAILAAGSLTAFADVTVTLPETELEAVPTVTDESGNVLYNVDIANSTATYATIVAVKGTTIKVGAIQYINQAEVVDGAANFQFALNDTLLDAAETEGIEGDVYVVTGGDGSMNVVGYIDVTEDAPEVTYFTISGTVTGYAGTTLPTVVVSDGTTNYPATVNSDGTFTVSVPTLAEGSYTLTATKTSHLSYTQANITAEATVNPEVLVGDVDESSRINNADIVYVSGAYDKNDGEEGYVAAYDVDESGRINNADIVYVAGNYDKNAISK